MTLAIRPACEGDHHLLKTGDSLGFGPPATVTYANESTRPCHYVVALARN